MRNITNITPPRVPLTDPATGLISREWYRFFMNLFVLAGSGTSSATVDDLLVDPVSTDQFADINRIYNEALLNAPSVQLGTLASVNQDNVRYLGFQTAPGLNYTPPVGTAYWNGGTTLTIQNTPNVAQPIGEAQYYYIKATANITKGQLIMFDGAVGASGQLKGKPATGLTTGEYLMGVAAENIAANAFGIVTSFGLVRGFDTTGGAEAWTQGTILYYNPAVPGGMTKTIPTAPNVKAIVATVVNAASGGSGSVFVRVTFGSKLGETDSNVQITSVADSQILQYDAALGYWKNVNFPAPTGVTTFSAGTTGFTPSTDTSGPVTLSGTLAVSHGGTGQTTAQAALNSLSGAVTSGYYLRGNGTNVTMSAIQAADVPTLNQNTTGTASNVTGVVATANGGTGKSSAYTQYGVVYAPTTTSLDNSLSLTVSSSGTVGVGLVAASNTMLYLGQNMGGTGVVSAFSLYNYGVIQPGTTLGFYNQSAITLAAGTTLNSAFGYNTVEQALPAGASVTSQFGFAISSTFVNGTSNYGFYTSNNAAIGAGKTFYAFYANGAAATGGGTTYNFYAANTAPNIFRGDTRFGSTTDPTATVDVTGTLKVSGAVTLSTALGLASGGTGQTTAQAAINALAGAVTSGQYLRGNGTNVVMSAIQAADVPTLNQNTTGTASNVTGTVAVANGGTGLTSITANRIPYASASNTYGTSADLTFDGTTFVASKGQFSQAAATGAADYCVRMTQSGSTGSAGRAIFDQNSTYALAVDIGSSGGTSATASFQWITRATGAQVTMPLRLNYNGSLLFGNYTVNASGQTYEYQPNITAKNAAATLTAAEVLTRILSYTGAAATVTLPTGTDLDAGANFSTNTGIEWSVINTGSGTCTVAVNTGITSLGALTVAAGASGLFRIRRTGAATFVIYRLA